MIATTIILAMLTSQPGPGVWIKPSPGLRINPEIGIVEFEATTCLAPDPNGRVVDYLELFVCSWDSREHESLLATDVKPSQVHAALLLAGAAPGTPAEFSRDEDDALIRTAPTGTPIQVTFHWFEDGETRSASPTDWVKHVDTDDTLPTQTFIFAGSQIDPTTKDYLADEEGTLISLVVFDIVTEDGIRRGVETIAWADPISHEQAIDETVWIADPTTYPQRDTDVIVRLTITKAAEEAANEDASD